MMRWPFPGRGERLRRQASDWVAKLNGPHDEADRAAFARWYEASPDHASAYDRLSALFDASRQIRPAASTPYLERSLTPQGQARPFRYALAAAAATVCVAALAFTVLRTTGGSSPPDTGPQNAVFATAEGESRHIALADGSEVILAPRSDLDVAIDGEQRRLRLRRGEARFVVFHDTRPFIVTARDTQVEARGTQFVVRLDDEGTLVSLIEGRVDVSYAPSPDRREIRVASLAPGERLVVPAARGGPPGSTSTAEAAPAPAMIEFDDTRLADAVEQVNRKAVKRVRLATPELAELRVTGAFRAGDAEGFAQGVAAALGLEVGHAQDGTLLLARAQQRP